MISILGVFSVIFVCESNSASFKGEKDISNSKIKRLASSLCSQHDTQAIFQNFSGENKILDIEEAYALQKHFVDIRLSQSKDEIAGYKIGLTSARMQRLLGIDSPIGGFVQKKEIRLSGAVVKKSSFSKVGLECEIIVLIGRDLPPVRDKKYEFDDIESSGYQVCHPALN